MIILVVNAGSSSHKLCLYNIQDEHPVAPLWKGSIDWSSQPPKLKVESVHKTQLEQNLKNENKEEGLRLLIDTLWKGQCKVIDALSQIARIGHRVVHGGTLFEKPIQITPAVIDQIKKLIPLAPLHNPANLEEIEFFRSLFPSKIQVAVFDTTFHLSMTEKVKTYPLPKKWRDYGIQRFGFHGISHEYCAEKINSLSNKKFSKIINCHLGNGCSLCAIENGKSVATTMGFTPLEGLMMGSRSGSIDPGILIYLMEEKKCSRKDLEHVLNFESGLKGIAGTSDMRKILENKDKESELGLEMFIFRLKGFIGEMAAALGGLDALSFTGGIGENSAAIRKRTCAGLEFLNLKLDVKLNNKNLPDTDIADIHSKVRILTIHTEEEWMIARACYTIKDSNS